MQYLNETVNTVMGPKRVYSLGRILTHEHLTIDYTSFYKEPTVMKKQLDKPKISLTNIGVIKQYPYSNKFNLTLNDLPGQDAVKNDIKVLLDIDNIGKMTIVENSSHGLQRDLGAMEQYCKYFESIDRSVNIIVGTGYYLDSAQPASVVELTEEQMYDEMYKELENGCQENPSIKAGFIGEVGSDWPISDFEKRSIKATGALQEQLRCSVSFHPGRNESAPEEILRIYQEAGGTQYRAIMSHLERTFDEVWDLVGFVQDTKCYCQLDLFGIECSLYQLNEKLNMPSDAQRIKIIQDIKEQSPDLLKRVLMSHDIHTKHRLISFGGHGYSHIYNNVIPLMKQRDFTEKEINLITIENPRTWLIRR